MTAPVAAQMRRLPQSVAAAFYRGGTSRGLLFHDVDIAPFDRNARDRILCSVMGSPDPDGRQIDGLGGGASSLSKIAIVSPAGSAVAQRARAAGHPLAAGYDWIDEDVQRTKQLCDIVYRFGQVPINSTTVDWTSTCGNMVAAVAHFAVQEGLVRPEVLAERLPLPSEDQQQQHSLPVKILAHDSAKIVTARVPVEYFGIGKDVRWLPAVEGKAEIAGVPGQHPGIIIESPLDGSVLSTGRAKDLLELDGETIPVSVIDTGLPVVLISAKALGAPLETLTAHPASIDSNRPFMDKIERLREAASHLSPELKDKFSSTAPKVCVVHPRATYESTGETTVSAEDMDVLIRTVSVGQLHRTIPATTLSALSASLCFGDSIVSEILRSQRLSKASTRAIQEASPSDEPSDPSIRAITVGQPAGLSTASVQVDENGLPKAVVMLRTARRIMQGQVLAPPNCVPYSEKA